MQRNDGARDGLHAPNVGGARPRDRLLLASLAAVASLGVAAACSNGSADQVTGPIALGMSSAVMPSYSDGNITLYDVYAPVPFPVRHPTPAESSALGPTPKATAYRHAPFLLASDESVEVHYVISNLEDTTESVWLLVDPWNEFVRWKPGVTVVSDEETDPNFGYDQEFSIPPKSRIEGTLIPDDLQEMAIKLASVEYFLASPTAMQAESPDAGDNSLDPTQVCDNIFNPQNRSNSGDPIFAPWIPPVIAGLTGFDLGLRVQDTADSAPTTVGPEGGSAAPNIAIEITVDVQDLSGSRDRFVAQGTGGRLIGIPSTILSPPAARF
jgi:hypothetical protein